MVSLSDAYRQSGNPKSAIHRYFGQDLNILQYNLQISSQLGDQYEQDWFTFSQYSL